MSTEAAIKSVMGDSISEHITMLQSRGIPVLSQYAIGIPAEFRNGPMMLPITVLDKTGTQRLHIGDLAILVQNSQIDPDEIEEVWFDDPMDYIGRDYQFYGVAEREEIPNASTALDSINHVLSAIDAGLSGKNALGLMKILSPRSSRSISLSGATEEGQQPVAVRQSWGQYHRGPGGTQNQTFGKKRYLDTSSMPKRQHAPMQRDRVDMNKAVTGSTVPTEKTLKNDLVSYLNRTSAPTWFRMARKKGEKEKLEDWLAQNYITLCTQQNAHYTPEAFLAVAETQMLEMNILAPFCTLHKKFTPAGVSNNVLVCDQQTCNVWASNNGHCDRMALRVSKEFLQ